MLDRRRLISGSIGLYYLVLMWRREGLPGTLALCIPLAIPLALIWYSGSISRMEGWGWARTRIDKASPPASIRMLGWVLLLTPMAIMAVNRLRGLLN